MPPAQSDTAWRCARTGPTLHWLLPSVPSFLAVPPSENPLLSLVSAPPVSFLSCVACISTILLRVFFLEGGGGLFCFALFCFYNLHCDDHHPCWAACLVNPSYLSGHQLLFLFVFWLQSSIRLKRSILTDFSHKFHLYSV